MGSQKKLLKEKKKSEEREIHLSKFCHLSLFTLLFPLVSVISAA